MTMRDRLAKAICCPGECWAALAGAPLVACQAASRYDAVSAVLAVLQHPSPEMMEAALNARYWRGRGGERASHPTYRVNFGPQDYALMTTAFKAAIAAVLENARERD